MYSGVLFFAPCQWRGPIINMTIMTGASCTYHAHSNWKKVGDCWVIGAPPPPPPKYM